MLEGASRNATQRGPTARPIRTTAATKSNGNLPAAAIIGIVIGGAFVLMLIFVVLTKMNAKKAFATVAAANLERPKPQIDEALAQAVAARDRPATPTRRPPPALVAASTFPPEYEDVGGRPPSYRAER